MYIKAKYPVVGNEYVGYQGYGGLSGGQTVSSILSQITDREIVKTSTGYMFGGQKLVLLNYDGEVRSLSFENESPEWLSDQSVSVVVRVNEERFVGTLLWNNLGFWELTFVKWND